MKRIAFAIVAAGMTVAASSAQSANIVETAQQAGSFKTLLAAAQAAGLVDALSGGGPLTVFAPPMKLSRRFRPVRSRTC